MVELVGVLEARGAEALRERAVRIVDLDHLLLDVMRACPAAHHLGELGPVVVRERHGVGAADAAAFLHEAKDALAHFRIVVNHAADVVQEDRVEFLDLRVFQQLGIVAEGGRERAGVLAHQLDQIVPVRDGGVARSPSGYRSPAASAAFSVSRAAFRGVAASICARMSAVSLSPPRIWPAGDREHGSHAIGHRGQHHAFERVQVLHACRRRTAGRFDR